MHRFLPVIFLIAVAVYLSLNFQTLKRDLAYRFNFDNDPTTSCCKEEQVEKSNGNFDESASIAMFDNNIVDYPKTSLAYSGGQTAVLGTTTASGEQKWIEVSLDEQKIRAWEGNTKVMEFPISSGKWGATPKGDYSIWYKTRYQRMTGGSKDLGTFYDLPNVPHNMFFYKGYALHGAYWHNNFGHPMSHGCVNEPLANAAAIFEWAGPNLPAGQNAIRASAENPGTRVYVH